MPAWRPYKALGTRHELNVSSSGRLEESLQMLGFELVEILVFRHSVESYGGVKG